MPRYDYGPVAERPYVFLNMAMTADGKIDTVERRGARISGAADSARVDRLRAGADAVMIGGRTLLSEDPRLTVRALTTSGSHYVFAGEMARALVDLREAFQISAETDEERMRPGMRFRGQVIAELVPKVLAVPHEAVTLRPEGAAVTVRTLFDQRRVYPALGRRNQEYFEVLGGLDEGDRVMLRGRDGAAP